VVAAGVTGDPPEGTEALAGVPVPVSEVVFAWFLSTQPNVKAAITSTINIFIHFIFYSLNLLQYELS
jgi:hypothetical protein